MQTMQIGELAQAAQTQTETIRFYEREGLLPPAARNAANYRVYEATHVLHLLEKELRRLRKQCSSSEAAADCGILTGLERAAGLPVAAVSPAPTSCGAGVLGLGTHRTKGRKDSAP